MFLGDWLDQNKERFPIPAFAAAIGSHRDGVYKYIRKERRPSAGKMRLIAEVTDNQVTPNDFYDIAPKPNKPRRAPKRNETRDGDVA